MKREQREPYLAIVQASLDAVAAGKQPGYTVLCGYCRFFATTYTGDYDSQAEVECEHPLPVVQEQVFERAFEGGDCWAFRPTAKAKKELELVA